MKHTLLYILLLTLPASVSAQTDRQMLRRGNRHYNKNAFDKAEEFYRKALSLNPQNHRATYNLGCVAMSRKGQQQNNDSIAIQRFVEAAEKQTDPTLKAQAFHNLGIIHQQHENYESAIDAYKHTLRLTPKDFVARYNLELCKKLLKKQQQNQQNQNQQQQNQQQNNKDNKDNKNDKDNKNNDKNKDNNKDKNDRQQPQDNQSHDNKNQMSKDNAQQMLNAAKQAERNTQQRLQKARQQKGGTNNRKNW